MKNLNPASYGIVLSGGGTRSAYAVGALKALAEIHGLVAPKVLVAISGGAAAGMFYLAGRFQDMYDWAWRFDDSRFISWSRFGRGPIMDVDFLVDGILSRQAPNLEQELVRVPTKRFVAATRFPDNTRHWFNGEPMFEQLRATKTMPGVSRAGVNIGGVLYADGCLSTSVQDCVVKAFDEGAERAIVIDNGSSGRLSLITRAILRFGCRNAPQPVRTSIEQFCEKETTLLQPDERVFVCRSEKLPSRHGIVRAKHLSQATIEQGYADAARLCLT